MIVSCLLVSLSCSFLLNMLSIVKLEGFSHNRMSGNSIGKAVNRKQGRAFHYVYVFDFL